MYKNSLRIFEYTQYIKSFWLGSMISILFLKLIGLDDIDISIFHLMWGVFILFLEIPTGKFADKYGYKVSIVLSYLFLSMTFISFLIAIIGGKYVIFFITALLLSLSQTLFSGAGSSYIYTIFRHDNNIPQYTHFKNKLSRNSKIIEGTAIIIGVYLYTLAPYIPYTIQAVLTFGATIASLYLRPAPIHHTSTSKYSSISSDISFFFHHRVYIYLAIFIVLATVSHGYFHGVINQSLFLETGVSVADIGIVGLGIYILSAIGIYLMKDIWDRFGEYKSYIIIIILLIISGTAFLIHQHIIWIILWSSVMYTLRELYNIFIDNSFHFRIKDDAKRATMLSIFGMFHSFITRLFFVFIGVVFSGYSYTQTMGVITIFFTSMGLLWFYYIVRKKL